MGSFLRHVLAIAETKTTSMLLILRGMMSREEPGLAFRGQYSMPKTGYKAGLRIMINYINLP